MKERAPQITVIDVGVKDGHLADPAQQDFRLPHGVQGQRQRNHDGGQAKSRQLTQTGKIRSCGNIPENQKSDECQGGKARGKVGIKS